MPEEKDTGKPTPDVSKLLKASPNKIPRAGEQASGPDRSIKWKLLGALAGGVAFTAILTYIYSLSFGSMVFNDGISLRNAFIVRDWDAFWNHTWSVAFTKPLTQPWIAMTYAWDFQSAAKNLLWYHLVNVSFHVQACLYFFLFTFTVSRQLKAAGGLVVDPYYLAFASAALFSCHPLAVEPVAYLSGRGATLLGLNYFLCLDCFLLGYLTRGALKFWGYVGSIVFGAVGILVSPEAMTLPAAILAVILLLKKPDEQWLDWFGDRKVVVSVIMLVAASLPYLIFTGVEFDAGNALGLPKPERMTYWATQFKAIPFYYLRAFLVPAGLSFDPPGVEARNFQDPWVIAGCALVLLSLVSVYLLRKQPVPALGLFLFILGLLPSGIAVQNELLSDRRFYLSLAGLCLCVGWLLSKLAARSFRTAAVIFCALLIVLCGLSIWRETAWQSTAALADATLSVNPDSSRGRALKALELLRARKILEAAREAQMAVKLNSNACTPYLATGYVLLHEKDWDGAVRMLGHALEIAEKENMPKPVQATARIGLAEALLRANKTQVAGAMAMQALESYPDSDSLHLTMGKCYLAAGNWPLALSELQTAVKINPKLEDAWEPLTKAAIPMGQYDLGLQAAERWVAYEPTDRSKKVLATAALLDKKWELAAAIVGDFLAKNPNDTDSLATMALIYDRKGDKEKSELYRQKTLKLDPHFFENAARNLEVPPGVQRNAESK